MVLLVHLTEIVPNSEARVFSGKLRAELLQQLGK